MSSRDGSNVYDAALMLESKAGPAETYRNWFVNDGGGADLCTECGECESKCPQSIPIPEMLKEAHAYLMAP